MKPGSLRNNEARAAGSGPAPFMFLLVAFVALLLDQLSKWAISERIIRPALESGSSMGLMNWFVKAPERLQFTEIKILPFFNIVMIWNKGVTFGLFNRETDYGPFLLTLLSLLICAFFIVWLFKTSSRVQGLGIALVIGGALGNVLDRLRFGAVIDFLDFHALGWHWPAFNLADSCIVVGIAVLIGYSFFLEKAFPR
jgi:signal peptidase II